MRAYAVFADEAVVSRIFFQRELAEKELRKIEGFGLPTPIRVDFLEVDEDSLARLLFRLLKRAGKKEGQPQIPHESSLNRLIPGEEEPPSLQ